MRDKSLPVYGFGDPMQSLLCVVPHHTLLKVAKKKKNQALSGVTTRSVELGGRGLVQRACLVLDCLALRSEPPTGR